MCDKNYLLSRVFVEVSLYIFKTDCHPEIGVDTGGAGSPAGRLGAVAHHLLGQP